MKAKLLIDAAIGETRRVLIDEDDRPFRLDIDRWSWRLSRAKLDEIYLGRCIARDPALGGWFVELGVGPPGFLTGRGLKFTEGEAAPVRIKSEARSDKGPSLVRASVSLDASKRDAPCKLSDAEEDTFLNGVELIEIEEGDESVDVIDAAIDLACEPIVTLPGGGSLSVEPTRALTAVDVDAAGRKSKGDRRAFVRDLNLAAAEETGRQIALRGLGGLIAVDFAHMDNRDDRDAVSNALKQSLRAYSGRRSEVAALSRFCIGEASLAWAARPIAEAYAGSEIVEAQALAGLRRLEREARARPGRPVELRVAADVEAWLSASAIDWADALADRIGRRFSIVAEPSMTVDQLDARSL